MQSGWIVTLVLISFILGGIYGIGERQDGLKQSARTGVIVIDGSLYVLLPAKRGVE